MENIDQLEELLKLLGDFGKYQFFQYMLYFVAAVLSGVHMLSFQMVSAVPNHRCRIPQIDSSIINFTDPKLEMYIPKISEEKFDSCFMFDLKYNNNSTIKCESWVYDTTYHKSSRGMEWNFVCDRQWMGAVAQSAFLFGVLVGVMTLGWAADKYGRRTIFCWSAAFQLIFGVAAAFVPEYYTFLIIQFFYGVCGSAGCFVTGFVLCMELIGPSKRTLCGVSLQAAFAVGVMLVAAWGAVIHDRQVLQLVYGLHGILLIGHWWWLDESPRWLWAKGDIIKAVKIVQNGLKINGSSIQLNINDYLSKITKVYRSTQKPSVFHFFKMPVLRNRTLNISFSWFTNSLLYYGLSLSTGKLYGNPFALLCLSGAVELPGYVITVVLMDRVGRRILTFFFMTLGGISCIIAAYLDGESIAGTIFAMIGKFSIATSFAIISNYTAELFPTVLRNSAIGFGSMCARFSATLTPLISLLDYLHSSTSISIFGLIASISGFFVLFLPETLGSTLPQTLEDGENFKVGDTAFTFCIKKNEIVDQANIQRQPLECI